MLWKAKKSREKKEAVKRASEQYICPLSNELMVDPVIAEDDCMYERLNITEYMEKLAKRKCLKSPTTKQPMGPNLRPAAIEVRRAIEEIARSGVLSEDKSRRWKQILYDENVIATLRDHSADGNSKAMYRLGCCYDKGIHGLSVDKAQAYHWYKMSADLNDPRGMAAAGDCLFEGFGTEKNLAHALHLVGQAAKAGSDYAAYISGYAYYMGLNGMPKDAEQAMFWFRKVVEKSCKIKQLEKEHIDQVAAWLQELEHSSSSQENDDENQDSFHHSSSLRRMHPLKTMEESNGSVVVTP